MRVHSNIRRYSQLTYESQKVAASLTSTWKFLRKYHSFISNLYRRLVIVAIKRGKEIPQSKINMECE